jgi:hypothetical protein
MERRWRDCLQRSSLPMALNLGVDGGDGHLYALHPHDHALDSLSADSLLAALRTILPVNLHRASHTADVAR